MTNKKAKSPEVLAAEHWNWLRSILEQQLEVHGKMYKDAFIHGYKHGATDVINRIKEVSESKKGKGEEKK